MNLYDVFISYRRIEPDLSWARMLAGRLRQAGLRVFVDDERFELGAALVDEMQRGIVSSRVTLAVVTQNWLDGPNTGYESVLARQRALGNDHRLIALLREPGAIARGPLIMQALLAVDMSDDSRFEAEFANLVQRLRQPVPDSTAKDFYIHHHAQGDDMNFAKGFLAAELLERGFSCVATADFVGEELTRAAATGMGSARCVLFVISDAYHGDPRHRQVADMFAQLRSEDPELIGAVIQIDRDAERDIPLSLRVLPRFDATSPASRANMIAHLVGQSEDRLIWAVPECPYPGLLPYEDDNSALFFGRQAETEQAVRQVLADSWLVVIGPSGSGKSSLIRAGVIPRLVAERDVNVVIVPVDDDAVGAVARLADEDAWHPEDGRRVVFVDQLEQAFLPRGGQPPIGPQLADQLSGLAGSGVCVVATLRADFYPQLMESALWEHLADPASHRRLDLGALSVAQLHQVIREPARSVGVYVESALVERLVDDSRGQPGPLPLLQETMRELWPRIERRYLPFSSYLDIVTRAAYSDDPTTALQVALSERAHRAYVSLPSDEARLMARRILVNLVQVVDGRPDVRRQRAEPRLRLSGDDPALFGSVVDALVAARLVTVTASSTDTTRRLDLAHEALIRGWPELGRWVDEARASEPQRRKLQESVENWDERGRANGGLLDDVELGEAQSWLETPAATLVGIPDGLPELVDASSAHLRAQRRKSRRNDMVVRAAAVLFAALLVVAVLSYIRANRERDEAEHQRTVATSNELAALAQSLPPQLLDRSILLGLSAVTRNRSPRSEAALLAALNRNPQILRESMVGSSVTAFAGAPDGTSLAVGSQDGTLTILETASLRPARKTVHVDGTIRTLAFDPSGQRLAVGTSTGVFAEYDTMSMAPTPTSGGVHDGSIRAVAYSPDGRWLATGGADHIIRLTDRHGGQTTTLQDTDWVNALAFSGDSARLVSGSGQTEHRATGSRAVVWDVATGAATSELCRCPDAVRGVAVSPDGHRIAAALADNTVRMWDSSSGTLTWQTTDHTERVYAVAFSKDGRYVASASRDATIRLWTTDTGQPALVASQASAPLAGHDGGATGVVTLPNGILASAGADGRVVVWDPARTTPTRLAQPVGDAAEASVVAADAGGDLAATGYLDGRVDVRHGASGQSLQVLDTGGSPVTSLAFLPTHLLVTANLDGTIAVWDATTGSRAAGPVKSDSRNTLAVSPDGALIASGGLSGEIRLWGATLTPVAAPIKAHTGEVTGLVFTASASLVSASADTTIRVWTGVGSAAAAPAERQVAAPSSLINAIAVSPDRRRVAAGNADGQIVLYDLDGTNADRTTRPILNAGGVPVVALAWAGDGTTVYSASQTGDVELWSVNPSLQAAGTLGSRGTARSLSVSSDGTALLVAGGSGRTDWVLDRRRWEDVACQTAGRNLTAQELADVGIDPQGPPACAGHPVPAGTVKPGSASANDAVDTS